MRIAAALLLSSTACSSVMADKDGRVFGEDLGSFRVNAELETSSCGPEALGTPQEWTFDVQMSREYDTLFWNQGAAAVEGVVSPDGVTFSLESVTVVPVPLDEADEPPTCVMNRFDRASGRLDDAGYDVTGFSGTLRYRFDEQPETDCTTLIGVPGGFEELPCDIQFAIDGVRTLAPEDRR